MNIFLLLIYIVLNGVLSLMVVNDLRCWSDHNAKTRIFLVMIALLAANFWRLIYSSI